MTRKQIVELGIVATQCGISDPGRLQQIIRRGMMAEYRVPMALGVLELGNVSNAQFLLKGWAS